MLAVERGESGAANPEGAAARYQRLSQLIKELPAIPLGVALRPDWERTARAAIDAAKAAASAPATRPAPRAPAGELALQPASGAAPVATREPAPAAAGAEPEAIAPAREPATPEPESIAPAREPAAAAPEPIAPAREPAAPEPEPIAPAFPGAAHTAPRHRARRRMVAAAVAAAAAALVVVTVYRGRQDRELGSLAIELMPGPRPHRGADPSAGDTLVIRGAVDGPGDLRVYDDAGIEQARCVSPAPDCAIERDGSRTTLRLTVLPTAPGELQAVLFAAPLAGPSRGRDGDVGAATRAGIAIPAHVPISIH